MAAREGAMAAASAVVVVVMLLHVAAVAEVVLAKGEPAEPLSQAVVVVAIDMVAAVGTEITLQELDVAAEI